MSTHFPGPPIRKRIYFATRQPWSKSQKDDYKKEWKDVVQYRTAERGDAIFALDLSAALARHAAAPAKPDSRKRTTTKSPTSLRARSTSPPCPYASITCWLRPTACHLAFVTNAINQRQEKSEDVEIYTFALMVSRRALDSHGKPDPDRPYPIRITHNQAAEIRPRWANDSRHIFFSVEVGRRLRPLPRPAAASVLGGHRSARKSSNGPKTSSARSSAMSLPPTESS